MYRRREMGSDTRWQLLPILLSLRDRLGFRPRGDRGRADLHSGAHAPVALAAATISESLEAITASRSWAAC